MKHCTELLGRLDQIMDAHDVPHSARARVLKKLWGEFQGQSVSFRELSYSCEVRNKEIAYAVVVANRPFKELTKAFGLTKGRLSQIAKANASKVSPLHR